MRKFLLSALFLCSSAVAQNTVTLPAIEGFKQSVIRDGADNYIHLDGDADTPGNDKCYSTNGSGVRGWYDCAAGAAEINDLSSTVTWTNIPAANVPQAAVTQHQAALAVTESQISDLSHTVDTDTNLTEEEVEDFAGSLLGGTETRITVTYDDAGNAINFVVDAETNDLSSAVTWTNIPAANVPQTAVTQHQAALAITESQISDLSHTVDTDTNLTEEEVEDFAGSLLGGTETRITVTYDDAGNAINFVVDDMNDDVPESGDFGNAADLTATGALDTGVIDALNLVAGALCGTNQILEDQGASWVCIDTPSGGGGGGTTITTFQVKDDGTTGQLTTGTAADLTGIWATPEITDSDFSWNGTTGTLTVNNAGTLELNINVCSWNNANNRHELHVQIREDAGGGFANIHEASTYTSRNNTQDEGCVSIPGYLRDVASGDDFRLRIFDIGSAATVGDANVSGETYISAKLYK